MAALAVMGQGGCMPGANPLIEKYFNDCVYEWVCSTYTL